MIPPDAMVGASRELRCPLRREGSGREYPYGHDALVATPGRGASVAVGRGAESAPVTPETAAAATARSVGIIDAAWSTDPGVLRRARSLELSAWAFWLAGRGGVLGDGAHPDAVTAALGLVAPDAARLGWDAAGRVGPSAIADARQAECARWGSRQLSETADDRLVDLLDRVVWAADSAALPIFAAARARMTATGDAGARAAVLISLLHEHRAGVMLVATRACGLRPVEALIAGPEGVQEALTLGWSPPFPSRLAVLRRFAYAEGLANRMAGAAFRALDRPERVELVGRLNAAAAVVAAA
jgi:hypothetical protein